mmetsp:Transcript_37153/g.83235  ORF Transcript_37153/g.83235 Transcript_37153/m.83235 type:complete len:774 (-) Transcript_37153:345-2666(-)
MSMLTEEQAMFIEAQRLSQKYKPVSRIRPPSRHWLRVKCFRVVTSHEFELFILSCIVANSIVMAADHFGQGEDYALALKVCNETFSAVFLVEAVLKLTGLGFEQYMREPWNRFDITIVSGSLVGDVVVAVAGDEAGGSSELILALRVFRLARLVRLVEGADSLRSMITVLACTVAGLVNVVALLGLLFFIYTAMGVQLFATIQFNGFYDAHANFRSFGTGFLTLFRFSTGESWNQFMHDMALAGGGRGETCDPNPEYDRSVCGFNDNNPACEPLMGCGSSDSYPFMYSFCLVVSFVSLNLFVTLILDAFSSAALSETLFSQEAMEVFRQTWMKYDEDATCFIETTVLLAMVQALPEPWGFGYDVVASEKQLKKRIGQLDLPLYRESPEHSPSVFYYDTIFAMAAYGIKENEQLKLKIALEKEGQRKKSFAKLAADFEQAELELAMESPLEAKRRNSRDSLDTSKDSLDISRGAGKERRGSILDTVKTDRRGSITELGGIALPKGMQSKEDLLGLLQQATEAEEAALQATTEKESVSNEEAGAISSMLKGKAGAMFNKMRNAVQVLNKRQLMLNVNESYAYTCTEDYAARRIQLHFTNFKRRQGSFKASAGKSILALWREDAATGANLSAKSPAVETWSSQETTTNMPRFSVGGPANVPRFSSFKGNVAQEEASLPTMHQAPPQAPLEWPNSHQTPHETMTRASTETLDSAESSRQSSASASSAGSTCSSSEEEEEEDEPSSDSQPPQEASRGRVLAFRALQAGVLAAIVAANS